MNAKGACIGPMGSRVRNVMTELHGEKIDIVDYSEDSAQFVGNALSPARVVRVHAVDAQARSAQVIVPDYQLSLAIGKEGQNARLAARLTGWKIDIQPDNPAAGRPPGPVTGSGPAAAGPGAQETRGDLRPGGTEPGREAGGPPARRPNRAGRKPRDCSRRGRRDGRNRARCCRRAASKLTVAWRLGPSAARSAPAVRTCVGCRARAAKSDLLRAAASGDHFVPDPQARLPGRGAYLHPSQECFELAQRRRVLLRALREPGPLGTGQLTGYLAGQGEAGS